LALEKTKLVTRDFANSSSLTTIPRRPHSPQKTEDGC